MPKNEILYQYYVKIIERIIGIYFRGETDNTILQFFRGVADVYASFDYENHTQIDTNVIYKAGESYNNYYLMFCQEHEQFSTEENLFKIEKFKRAYLIEMLEEDADKSAELVLMLKNLKESFEDFFYVEQVPVEVQPHIFDFAYLDKAVKKLQDKNVQESPPNIYFKSILTFRQQQRLEQWVSHHKYTPSPTAFINLLTSKNIAIEINSDKLHHVAYLIFRLYTHNPQLISLSHGKGYFQHFENHISRFSTIAGKRKLADYKREVVDRRNPKQTIIEEISKIIEAIKSVNS